MHDKGKAGIPEGQQTGAYGQPGGNIVRLHPFCGNTELFGQIKITTSSRKPCDLVRLVDYFESRTARSVFYQPDYTLIC